MPSTINTEIQLHCLSYLCYWLLRDGRGSTAADVGPQNNSGQLLKGAAWTGGRHSSARLLQATLEMLSPITTYYFRAVAINPGGTAYGENRTFATLPLPSVVGVTWQSDPLPAGSRLQFSGTPSAGYLTEASTNLLDWLAVTNLVAGSDGLFDFLGTSATSFPTCFYRLRVP